MTRANYSTDVPDIPPCGNLELMLTMEPKLPLETPSGVRIHFVQRPDGDIDLAVIVGLDMNKDAYRDAETWAIVKAWRQRLIDVQYALSPAASRGAYLHFLFEHEGMEYGQIAEMLNQRLAQQVEEGKTSAAESLITFMLPRETEDGVQAWIDDVRDNAGKPFDKVLVRSRIEQYRKAHADEEEG